MSKLLTRKHQTTAKFQPAYKTDRIFFPPGITFWNSRKAWLQEWHDQDTVFPWSSLWSLLCWLCPWVSATSVVPMMLGLLPVHHPVLMVRIFLSLHSRRALRFVLINRPSSHATSELTTRTGEWNVCISLSHSKLNLELWVGSLAAVLASGQKKNSGVTPVKCSLHQLTGVLKGQPISQHNARLWDHLGRDQITTLFSGTSAQRPRANVEAQDGRRQSLGHYCVLESHLGLCVWTLRADRDWHCLTGFVWF